MSVVLPLTCFSSYQLCLKVREDPWELDFLLSFLSSMVCRGLAAQIQSNVLQAQLLLSYFSTAHCVKTLCRFGRDKWSKHYVLRVKAIDGQIPRYYVAREPELNIELLKPLWFILSCIKLRSRFEKHPPFHTQCWAHWMKVTEGMWEHGGKLHPHPYAACAWCT